MSGFLVLDASTRCVSIGSIDPGQVPAGHSKVTITDADFEAVRRGDKRVLDGGTLQDTGRVQADANRVTIEQQARQALADNATFLAIATPTAAQNAAQAKALTRQVNGLIRLMLGILDATT